MKLSSEEIHHLIDKLPPFENMHNLNQCDWWFKQYDMLMVIVKENSCESSANCSGTSGTTTSTKDQVTSNDVPAAATPAKLSWCQIMDFPHLPDGEYPLRYHGERFAGSVGIIRVGRWVNLDPTKDKELEYFPIHLV